MMEIESEISRQNGMLQLTLIEIQITSYIYRTKDSKIKTGRIWSILHSQSEIS